MIFTIKKAAITTALICGVTASLCAKDQKKRAESNKPNLLFIFPDQYRLFALSLWSKPEYRNALNSVGDPVSTPNLDRLAKSGVVFTEASSIFPLSSPHRGMLMSGMYSTRNGLDSNACIGRTVGLDHNITCLTNVLSDANYETAYFGKVHWERTEPLFNKDGDYVGSKEAPGGHYVNSFDTYVPEGRGRFGNKVWFQQLKDDHFHALSYSNIPEFVDGKKDGEQYIANEFSTKKEADIIIEYLNNRDNSLRNAEKPFSLIWSINPPHTPYFSMADCEASEYEMFKDMKIEDLLLRDNIQYKNEKDKERLRLNAAIYFSLVSSVDREIGRVLNALDENNLSDNTIIVFTSDHGEMMGSQGKMAKPQIYDEAFRVPFVVSYKGVLEHRFDDLKLSTIDIMPTLLGMMGLGDKIPSTVDGKDFSKGVMSGKYSKKSRPQSSYYKDFVNKGVRNDKYTYLVLEDGSYWLFDIKKDPYQNKRIKFDDIPTKDVKELKDELGYWLESSEDEWFKNRKYSTLINYSNIK